MTAAPSEQTHDRSPSLPQPSPERSTATLPAAITFFVTRSQRRAICAALGRITTDRSTALLSALGLDTPNENQRSADRGGRDDG